jgi:hypothetical protein
MTDTPVLDVASSVEQDTLTFDLTATQYEFSEDPSRIVWLEGPGREGKTFAAIAALFRHRERMVVWYESKYPGKPVRPMQVAIIRDTLVNLSVNTVKSIQRGFPGLFSFKDGVRRMLQRGVEMHDLNAWYEQPVGDPPSWIDANLFGMDDLASLDRIQGGEYDVIWMEEPSPILSTGNNGIREEVFLVCCARITGEGSPKRLQVTMNPADEEHWTSRQQDDPFPSTAIYHIKKGDNKHVSPLDRHMMAAAYAGRADLTARFVEGRRAKVYDGVAVVPEFNETQHVAKEWILPDPSLEVIRCYDGGLNCSVVLAQITNSGRLFILDSLVGQNMGMTQLIETKLKYVLGRPRYQRVKKWRDAGDPSLVNREQSDSDHTAARIIETLLHTTYEPGIASWEVRREALKWLCTQSPGGVPMLQISPRISEGEKINWIKNGFAGGYCYRVTPDGRVLRDVPDKSSVFSHPCDAVSHVVAHIWFRPKEKQYPKPVVAQRQRAKGYGVGV